MLFLWFPTWWTSCCCWQDIWYSLGYFLINVSPSPTHLSSQNLILSPHPTFHIVSFWSTLFNWFSCVTSIRSCHHIDSLLARLASANARHPPYFDSNILTHNSEFYCSMFHLHFPSNALLNILISFIPKPPFSFGRQIVSHLTHATFFWFGPPPHRNLRWICTSLTATLLGILKRKKKKIGIDVRIDLIRVTRPPEG